MTIDESARRLGTLAWVEQRLFETLGHWVRAAGEPRLALVLATEARHHAAHALQLTALLPETRDHDPAALVSPPSDDDDPWSAVAGSGGPVAGLAILGPVLVAHLAELQAWLDDASAVRDGPGIRVVAGVLAEDRADRDLLDAETG